MVRVQPGNGPVLVIRRSGFARLPGGVMQSGIRFAAAAVLIAAASFVIRADVQTQSFEIQLQLGDLLYSEGRYSDSLEAYKNALRTAPQDRAKRPRVGLIASALRVAEFDLARKEAEKLNQSDPKSPDSMALYGDALWSAGRSEEHTSELQSRRDLVCRLLL